MFSLRIAYGNILMFLQTQILLKKNHLYEKKVCVGEEDKAT